MNKETAEKLRQPFPESAIGKLPKAGLLLDFVGHAAVTQRLLEVDPEWTWEPLGFDQSGLPAFDEHGGLWIRLTVCDVTRIGYGEPIGKGDWHDKRKAAIGNAIRNAAMRFGVALDLWAQDDISTTFEEPKPVADQSKLDDWQNQILKSKNMADLMKVGEDIGRYVVTDADKKHLLDMWTARKEEVS